MVGSLGTITPSQTWAILVRHATDEIAPLRLQELCRDIGRVSSLVAVHNTEGDDCLAGNGSTNNSTIIVDLSRQRMTDRTLNHLLHLAASMHLREFITQVAWGQNDPRKPVRAVQARKPSIRMPMFDKAKLTRFREEINIAASEANSVVSDPSLNATPNANMPSTAANNAPRVIPSMHLALRVPNNNSSTNSAQKQNVMLDLCGINVLTAIHREWHRIQRWADSVRLGQLRGATGHMFRDVIIVGRGVAVAALQFVYGALQHDASASMASRFGLPSASSVADATSAAVNRLRLGNLTGGGGGGTATANNHNNSSSKVTTGRRMHFITSVDPVKIASTLSGLDPASTVVVSVAVTGKEETGLATKILKNWLLQINSKKESVLSKHMILVTGNERIASVIHKPESVFVLPEHSRCEPFLSTSSATLLVRT
jgi:glucose-6-phosphate isomerase